MENKEKPQRAYLAPDVLLCLIINDNKQSSWDIFDQEEIINCTSGAALYEAIASCTQEEIEKYADRIRKLLDKVVMLDFSQMAELDPKFENYIHDEERKNHLREIALKQKD